MRTLRDGEFFYRDVSDIGQGGLGRVELVRVIQSKNSHPVGTLLAKKTLLEKFKENPEYVERFNREIILLKNMNHPNIVCFEGENTEEGPLCYFMPYYPKGSLNKNASMFNWEMSKKIEFFKKIAEALCYAHTKNNIHRDIKPDNILIDNMNQPIIADWGLGGFIHKESIVLDLTHANMGTVFYCSPEQWMNKNVGPHSDVYSLGMTMARILGNNQTIKPFLGCTNAQTTNLQLDILIAKMTNVDFSKRINNMQEVTRQLALIEYMEILS